MGCFSHCNPQVLGILEGREESLWPVLCNPGLDEDTLTLEKHFEPLKGLCLYLLHPHHGAQQSPPMLKHTHTPPIHPSIHPSCRPQTPFSEFLRHDQGSLKSPIGRFASFQQFLGKSSILEPFLDGMVSTSLSPCSVFPTHSTPGPYDTQSSSGSSSWAWKNLLPQKACCLIGWEEHWTQSQDLGSNPRSASFQMAE